MILMCMQNIFTICPTDQRSFNRIFALACCVYTVLYLCVGPWILLIFNFDMALFLYKCCMSPYLKQTQTVMATDSSTMDNFLLPMSQTHSLPSTVQQQKTLPPEWETQHFQPYIPTVQDTIKTVSQTLFSKP